MVLELSKSLSLDIGDIYQRGLLIEEDQQESYLRLMVDVWTLVDTYHQTIIRNWLINTDPLLNDEGKLIWFSVPSKGQLYDLPFDIEFATELPRRLAYKIYEALKEEKQFLPLGVRNAFWKLTRCIQSNQDVQDFNIFEKIRDLSVNAQKSIETFRNFKGGPAELNAICSNLLLPASTQFQVLVMDRILAQPNHPRYEETLRLLQGSYFKGSVGAFHKGVDGLFYRINEITETLYHRAEQLGLSRSDLLQAQTITVKDEHLFGEENEREDFVTRYWSKLQRLPFAEVQRRWGSSSLYKKYERTRHMEAATQSGIEHLSLFFFQLVDTAKKFEDPNSLLYTTLRAERLFEIRTERGYQQTREWLRENFIHLLSLLGEVFDEFMRRKHAYPHFRLPEIFGKALQEQNRGPTNAYAALHVSLGAIEEIQVSLQKEDDEDGVPLIQSCFGQLDQIIALVHTHSLENLENFFEICLAFPNPKDRLQPFQTIRAFAEKSNRLRAELEERVYGAFNRLETYGELEPAELSRVLAIIRKHNFNALGILDFSPINTSGYEEKFEKACAAPTISEKLLSFECLYEELKSLPSLNVLNNILKSWSREIKTDYLEYRTFVQENHKHLSRFAKKLVEEVRALLQREPGKSKRLRWRAFSFWDRAGENMGKRLGEFETHFGRIGSIKECRTLISQLSELRKENLDHQSWFRSDLHSKNDAAKKLGFKMSPALLSAIFADLTENYTKLRTIKRETDHLYYRVRQRLREMGIAGDIEYLKQSLNIEDIEQLKRIYSLKSDCQEEDLQLFAYSFIQRTEKMKNAIARAQKVTRSTEPKNLFTSCFDKFLSTYIEKKSCPPEFKLALLLFDEEYLDEECQYLLNFLNFTSPTKLCDSQTFKNIRHIFELDRQQVPHIKEWLSAFWLKIGATLRTFKPQRFQSNYIANQKTFLAQIRRFGNENLTLKP